MGDDNTGTGAQFIAGTLKGYGVTHIFFLETILRETMVELERLGIERILTHSEKAAAYMASGFGRMSGRPGVCFAQSVGAFNLASGLQEAYLSSAPVIAITGKKNPLFQGRKCYQEVSHDFFKPVTKYQAEVLDTGQLPNVLRQAFRKATTGVPGPVHMDVVDHMGRIIDNQVTQADVRVDEHFKQILSSRQMPDPVDVKRAARMIEQSKKPVILVGGGAAISGTRDEITALAEKARIPVISSVDGKDCMLGTHELNIGPCGTYSRWCANRTLYEAELVVAIGCSMADLVTHDFTLIGPGTKIIQIDIDPSALGLNYQNAVSILGDAKASVKCLIDAVNPSDAAEVWTKTAQGYLAEWRAELAPKIGSDQAPIRPERLCHEISRALPENGVLVADTGSSAIWTGTVFELTKPQQTYLRATGGSLGSAFPSAMGVKCAAPDRPVVCFTGDAGFHYHIAELETAARTNINTVTVVNNNSGYAQCKSRIDILYGDRPGNPGDLYDFRPVNFARIAEEMGCMGIRVERPEEIGPALEQAFAAERPVLIDAVVDIDCSDPPVWTPG